MTADDTSKFGLSARGANPSLSDLSGDEDQDFSYLVRSRRTRTDERRGRQTRHTAFRDMSEDSHGRIFVERDDLGQNVAYPMTYKPARFEEVWLRSSLRSFYEEELIVDVLAQIKGGKEANVYRCLAHPRTGAELLAVKVYRPRKFRNLANDRTYREGRQILIADGRPAKATDQRIMRALGKKTDYGVQVQHTSWLMHEYTTLKELHRDGAAVPEPVGANENAILMGYRGDRLQAAPALYQISLGRREAGSLFAEVLRNVDLLLQHGLVHGDLSAYNILYWDGAITLIDFPQVTVVHANRNAQAILQRDVRRVCEYFARQGVRRDPLTIAADLWDRYGQKDYGEPEFGIADDDEIERDEDDERE